LQWFITLEKSLRCLVGDLQNLPETFGNTAGVALQHTVHEIGCKTARSSDCGF